MYFTAKNVLITGAARGIGRAVAFRCDVSVDAGGYLSVFMYSTTLFTSAGDEYPGKVMSVPLTKACGLAMNARSVASSHVKPLCNMALEYLNPGCIPARLPYMPYKFGPTPSPSTLWHELQV